MLTALCMLTYSFLQIMDCYQKIENPLQNELVRLCFDYYEGSLFRRLHSRHMNEFNPLSQISIFKVIQ